ncbi:MAG: hypothetical protein LBI41_03315 [Lactobacillales bacterium]|nr:hypothetical protein [Lactobacillales bacterium]
MDLSEITNLNNEALISLIQKMRQSFTEQLGRANEASSLKDKTIEYLTTEIQLLREQVTYLIEKRFGRSKDTLTNNVGQLSLFEDEAEIPAFEEVAQEITVSKHKRKVKGKKAELLGQFPEMFKELTLSHKERTCEHCGENMEEMGVKEIRSQVNFFQAQLRALVQRQHAYSQST